MTCRFTLNPKGGLTGCQISITYAARGRQGDPMLSWYGVGLASADRLPVVVRISRFTPGMFQTSSELMCA